MKFNAIIQLSGKTATGIEVPSEVVESLGSGKKPPVKVTPKGHTYRTTIASMGGKFMLSLSAENREKAGVAAGDKVQVQLELDNEPRSVSIPDDFAKALAGNAAARQFFEGLSYSHQLRHVLAIEQAKTAETRQNRIAKALAMLKEGKK